MENNSKKTYYQKNRDTIIEKSKTYYENNKERVLKQKKDYYKSNRNAKIEYQKNYYKCPEKKKLHHINTWKKLGIVSEDFDKLYNHYIECDKCEKCETQLTNGRGLHGKRHLDHDHETGEFRNVLCGLCNINLNKNKSVLVSECDAVKSESD